MHLILLLSRLQIHDRVFPKARRRQVTSLNAEHQFARNRARDHIISRTLNQVRCPCNCFTEARGGHKYRTRTFCSLTLFAATIARLARHQNFHCGNFFFFVNIHLWRGSISCLTSQIIPSVRPRGRRAGHEHFHRHTREQVSVSPSRRTCRSREALWCRVSRARLSMMIIMHK